MNMELWYYLKHDNKSLKKKTIHYWIKLLHFMKNCLLFFLSPPVLNYQHNIFPTIINDNLRKMCYKRLGLTTDPVCTILRDFRSNRGDKSNYLYDSWQYKWLLCHICTDPCIFLQNISNCMGSHHRWCTWVSCKIPTDLHWTCPNSGSGLCGYLQLCRAH